MPNDFNEIESEEKVGYNKLIFQKYFGRKIRSD